MSFIRAMFLSVVVLGFAAHAQAAKYRVERSYPLGGPNLGKKTVIQFSLFRVGEPNPLKAEDLNVEHEKLIHMMAIDSGFQAYLHEHPEEVSPGVWQVPITLNTAGDYRFYLQFRPEGELITKTVSFDDRFVSSPQQVVPSSPVHPEENLTFKAGEYKVTLRYIGGAPVQKKVAQAYFTVEKNGVKIPITDLDNYLGAKMHIAAISADKADFVHAHPGDGRESIADDDPIPAEITKIYFQQPGYYGLFMQFSYKGVVYTNQFALQVKKP